ncbi:MAG: amidohydrolase family protein [Desulfobacterium sp.]|nr:amidohydrolase family protein [Desulfobacterium sp.]
MMANDYRTTDFDAVTTAVGEASDLGICCFGDILTPRDTAISDILTKIGVYHTCFCEAFGFYKLLEENNLLGENYSPPMKTPVEYVRDLGLLDNTTLAVHCVHLTDKDLEILAATGTNVCLCPRSNEFIGVGRGPWEKILAAGICVSLGTDNLASNHDLNLWNELSYFIREINMDLSMSDAIPLVTHNPAKALLLNDRLGTLEKGKLWKYAVMPDKMADL